MSGPSFQYSRAANVHDALIQASRPGTAFLAGGTDLLQLWKSGAMAPAGGRRHLAPAAGSCGIYRWTALVGGACPAERCRSHPDVTRYHPLIARRSWPAPADRYATWRRSAAICCSEPVARIFATRSLPATSESPAADAARLPARTAKQPCSAQARPASRPTPRIWPLRWRRWTPRSRCSERRASGASRCAISTACLRETPERDTNLAPGELITGVHVPNATRFAGSLDLSQSSRSCVVRIRRRIGGRGVAVENGRIVEARLAAGGVAPLPWRLTGVKRHWSAAHRTPKPSPPPAIWPSSTPGRSPTTDSRSRCCAMP